jgi:hypothetical protein
MKFGICMGINYRTTPSLALSGCVADAKQWQTFLQSRGFLTRLMTDERTEQCTRAAIVAALEEMVSMVRPGDTLAITYSGHGTNRVGIERKEIDGRDECLVPSDFHKAGPIADDDIAAILAKAPQGSKVTLFLDCCHSGTMRDLEYTYRGARSFRNSDGKRMLADVACMSGCRYPEYSYESSGQGAFTRAFMDVAAHADELDAVHIAKMVGEAVAERFPTQHITFTASTPGGCVLL